MASEITKRDISHNTKLEKKRLAYGRGSKVRARYNHWDVYTLVKPKGGFWQALNVHGNLISISADNIGQVMIDGKWHDFNNNPREWKKVF